MPLSNTLPSSSKTMPLRAGMACVALFLAVQAAHAAPRHPKPIRDAEAKGAKVVATFPAASGLTGWVVSQNGTYSMAFTTADRKTLIVGELIDEKGKNLNDHYADKYFPKAASAGNAGNAVNSSPRPSRARENNR
ncbi:MAG TPA: hypothetical protein VEC01_11720 [Noviherbaspirillum sp.]|uniref:hypothetical protein n=1 Tax=Noviherbaspirillum sp. TaxID=1926288 RepID=UPI002D741A57|nr:hypothetical protein [Noviherbaspirillum sp.]HYD95986.1 hypothetical protein [Noviherbaspirillum sp.]